VKNILILWILLMLLVHNISAFYAEVFIAGDVQWDCFNQDKDQQDVLSFTVDQSDIAYQYIFDSEFKNINASITVFEEHRNFISEIKSSFGHLASFTVPEFITGINLSSFLIPFRYSIPNSCKQALLGNLFSFRL
jgi:hypothetical protein